MLLNAFQLQRKLCPPGGAMLVRGLPVFAVATVLFWTQLAGSGSVEQEIRRMESARLAYQLESTRWADDIDNDDLFMQGTEGVQSKQETIEAYKNNIRSPIQLM